MQTIHRLTLDDALVVLRAAEAEAERIGVRQTICVADDGAHPIALHRMTGARLTGVEIAIAKAFTAAGHQRATHLFNEAPDGPALPGNEAFGIQHMHTGRFTVFVGGFPLVHDGQVVGAVGISGGNGEQDKAVGAAALAAFEQHVAGAVPA
ncbi:heme-binding protein [Pseudonocardia kongjuensis]|uniref:Heme-binding protein n=1 Tax=Pseudonocardia kongjuensis TaxID=102227 RepID=A0ABN1Y3M5_9PSEU